MDCPGCIAEAECELYEGPTLAHVCEAKIDVLYVPADMFLRIPQVGKPVQMSFTDLARNLAKPVEGDRKDVAGAYSPALYTNNIRRKSSLVHVCCLVIDIDEGGHSARKLAGIFERRKGVVHTTFNSTPASPRCRVLLELASPIDVPTYDKLHAHYRAALLKKWGIKADTGAKDASRLSYLPVVKKGQRQETIGIDGETLDGLGLVARMPPEPVRPPPMIIPPDHRDKYVTGAMRSASDAVLRATPGERHYVLAKEAWGLARLELSEREIVGALLSAFVATAGEARRAEGERTIRGQVRDRNGRS
jgi:hypothetical protein